MLSKTELLLLQKAARSSQLGDKETQEVADIIQRELDAPEPKPLAWIWYSYGMQHMTASPVIAANHEEAQPLFTAPPAQQETKLRGLSDEEIIEKAHRMAWKYKFSKDPNHSDTYTFNRHTMIDFARAVLRAAQS